MLINSAVQTVAPLYFGKVVDAALESMGKLMKYFTVLSCFKIHKAPVIHCLSGPQKPSKGRNGTSFQVNLFGNYRFHFISTAMD